MVLIRNLVLFTFAFYISVFSVQAMNDTETGSLDYIDEATVQATSKQIVLALESSSLELAQPESLKEIPLLEASESFIISGSEAYKINFENSSYDSNKITINLNPNLVSEAETYTVLACIYPQGAADDIGAPNLTEVDGSLSEINFSAASQKECFYKSSLVEAETIELNTKNIDDFISTDMTLEIYPAATSPLEMNLVINRINGESGETADTEETIYASDSGDEEPAGDEENDPEDDPESDAIEEHFEEDDTIPESGITIDPNDCSGGHYMGLLQMAQGPFPYNPLEEDYIKVDVGYPSTQIGGTHPELRSEMKAVTKRNSLAYGLVPAPNGGYNINNVKTFILGGTSPYQDLQGNLKIRASISDNGKVIKQYIVSDKTFSLPLMGKCNKHNMKDFNIEVRVDPFKEEIFQLKKGSKNYGIVFEVVKITGNTTAVNLSYGPPAKDMSVSLKGQVVDTRLPLTYMDHFVIADFYYADRVHKKPISSFPFIYGYPAEDVISSNKFVEKVKEYSKEIANYLRDSASGAFVDLYPIPTEKAKIFGPEDFEDIVGDEALNAGNQNFLAELKEDFRKNTEDSSKLSAEDLERSIVNYLKNSADTVADQSSDRGKFYKKQIEELDAVLKANPNDADAKALRDEIYAKYTKLRDFNENKLFNRYSFQKYVGILDSYIFNKILASRTNAEDEDVLVSIYDNNVILVKAPDFPSGISISSFERERDPDTVEDPEDFGRTDKNLGELFGSQWLKDAPIRVVHGYTDSIIKSSGADVKTVCGGIHEQDHNIEAGVDTTSLGTELKLPSLHFRQNNYSHKLERYISDSKSSQCIFDFLTDQLDIN